MTILYKILKIPHNFHLSSNNFIIYCKKVTFIHQTLPDYALVVPMSYYTPPLHHYSHHHHMSPLYYYTHKQPPPNYTGFSCCHWRFLEFLRLCFLFLFLQVYSCKMIRMHTRHWSRRWAVTRMSIFNGKFILEWFIDEIFLFLL